MRAVALVLGLWCSSAWAAPVVVQVGRDGRSFTVEVRGTIDAPLGLLERIISDVAGYPAWIPAVASASRSPEGVDTVWKLPWPLGRVHERWRMERRAPADGVIVLSWRQLRGDLRRDEGSWTLVSRGARTDVCYRITFQLHRWVPPFMVEAAQRRAGPRLLRNLAAYARTLSPAVSVPSLAELSTRG